MSRAFEASDSRRQLCIRLALALAAAFAGSMALTWFLHATLARRNAMRTIDVAFDDVGHAMREEVDRRLIRQAMAFRDKVHELAREPWWGDPRAAAPRLKEIADALSVDELYVADAKGMMTHSLNPDEPGNFDFTKVGGQARDFAKLLDGPTELAQPLQPNTIRGEMMKYAGVWLPEGGFVQVGARAECVRRLARTAITGLTHNRHVDESGGYIAITTPGGTVISHPDEGRESGQWEEPGDDCFWKRRDIEGFPVYVVLPKKTTAAERRMLVGVSAVLNATALVLAAALAALAIAAYMRTAMRARRERELKAAAAIQESAVPRVFPAFPEEKSIDIYASMHPAANVGGDFYDFFFCAPRKIAFLVADVSGKGVAAALFMMKAKALVRGKLENGQDLPAAVEAVNNALCEGNAADMFVTAWIGELDLDTGDVRYVNAGHNPPFALRGGSKTECVAGPRALVLGAIPGVKYPEGSLSLAKGDSIYLYTDGVTEQTDAKKALFGEERLAAALEAALASPGGAGAAAIIDRVAVAVRIFASSSVQSDDITQLVLRRV